MSCYKIIFKSLLHLGYGPQFVSQAPSISLNGPLGGRLLFVVKNDHFVRTVQYSVFVGTVKSRGKLKR